jgi:glycosyltransferase involved in cell wall biosynthesis
MAALKLSGKRIVYTPHDIVHNKRYLLNDAIVSMIYSLVDRVILHKDANLHTMASAFGVDPKKLRIIPHGGYEYFVDGTVTKESARKELGFRQDWKVLLFFGNIKPGKGLDILLAAMPKVIMMVPDVKLVIAGRLSNEKTGEWLRKATEGEGISDCVISMLGFIPEKDTLYYYMASDMVVLPYTEVSESGVLRYAQTCGKAVICSDLKEFADTVFHGKTGYIFKNRDADDLADQIIFALPDGQIEMIGQNARRIVEEHYSWHKIAIVTKRVYDEILN